MHEDSGSMKLTDEAAATHRRRVEDACEAFLLSVDTPDASSLERIIERFPDCAAELTDFAVEWAAQDLQPADFAGGDEWDPDWYEASTESSPSPVEKAMDRLRQALDAPADPFAGLAAGDLRSLAARLGLDTTLLAKIRHRRLRPETVPKKLVEALATALGLGINAVDAHLQAPALVPAGANFKSDARPEAQGQQSFSDALESSSLDDEARRRWLDD